MSDNASTKTAGPWLQEYRRGRRDFEKGIKGDAYKYDGPYRLGWFEASKGISADKAEEIGLGNNFAL